MFKCHDPHFIGIPITKPITYERNLKVCFQSNACGFLVSRCVNFPNLLSLYLHEEEK